MTVYREPALPHRHCEPFDGPERSQGCGNPAEGVTGAGAHRQQCLSADINFNEASGDKSDYLSQRLVTVGHQTGVWRQ